MTYTGIKLVCPLQHFLEQRSILLVELVFEFVAYGVNRREFVAPLKGPGGVNDGA